MGILKVEGNFKISFFVCRIITMKSIALILASLAIANAGKFPTGLAPCRKFNISTNCFFSTIVTNFIS
jgi:hypothetical protein